MGQQRNPGSCAYQEIIAVVRKDNVIWIGSNWCRNAQDACPAQNGTYQACRDVCMQGYHAEAEACLKAGSKAKGGVIYIIGASSSCEICKKLMMQCGLTKIVYGKLPKGDYSIDVGHDVWDSLLGNRKTSPQTLIDHVEIEKMYLSEEFAKKYKEM